jgi:asparagine synthase
MAGPCATPFQDEVLSGASPIAGLVDVSYVARLFADHRQGRADHAHALWTVWMLSRWYDRDSAGAMARAVSRTGTALEMVSATS